MVECVAMYTQMVECFYYTNFDIALVIGSFEMVSTLLLFPAVTAYIYVYIWRSKRDSYLFAKLGWQREGSG